MGVAGGEQSGGVLCGLDRYRGVERGAPGWRGEQGDRGGLGAWDERDVPGGRHARGERGAQGVDYGGMQGERDVRPDEVGYGDD